MDIYKRAEELFEETVRHRRFFHSTAETGTDMPLACEYICDELMKCGIEPKKCGGGVTGVIGTEGPVILLRADMDALPIKEETGLPYANKNGCSHSCGHDFHAAMLLTAAKILSEQPVKGRVKLMFQPAEELLCGAGNMIRDGILDDPVPEAAVGFHIGPRGEPGEYFCSGEGAMMLSCDGFEVTVTGKGGHSGYPHYADNPINAAVDIYNGIMKLSACEADPSVMTVISVGCISSGSAYNVIPDSAVIRGSLRTSSEEERQRLKKRIADIMEQICRAYNCGCSIKMTAENPPLICDNGLVEEMTGYLREITKKEPSGRINSSGSDDFARIGEKISTAYFFLSAGESECEYMSHDPRVLFSEKVLPLGAAAYAYCAAKWCRKS